MPDGQNFAEAHYTQTSPSLLSRQPVAPARISDRSPDWWNVAFPQFESRLTSLRNWRWSWWWAWQDLAAYNCPNRFKQFISPNNMNRGRPLNDQIIDSTGLLAVNICAAGMWNGTVNPARPWMKLALEPAWGVTDPAAIEWLQHATDVLYTLFARSNFYTTMAQAMQDVAVFGTAPVIMYEDEQDGLRCYLPCAGEYFLGTSARQSNDTLYREFTYTVAQIVGFFGHKNCPYQIQEMWRQGGAQWDYEFTVIHVIEPNVGMSNPRSMSAPPMWLVPRSFPFREVYYLKGNKSNFPLSRRGFHEQPFMAARWKVTSNDPYGRSPAMDCIGDNKQIQQMTLRQNELGEKLVRPPMVAPPEMKNEPASIMPGMITYTNAMNGKPMFTPAFEVDAQGLQWIIGAIDKIGARVKSAMFVDVFMAITQMAGVQPRNEMELTKRDLERLQVLGPFIELFENEFAGPAVRRALSIAERRGLVKPRPPSLRKVPLKIEYESIIRLAQRASKSVAMRDFATTVGVATAAAQTANAPPPARKVNWDKWVQRYGSNTDVDADLFFSEEEVKEHDAIREKAAKEAQEAEAAPALLQTSVDAAKNLSQTPLNNGSALDAIMGSGAYPGQ